MIADGPDPQNKGKRRLRDIHFYGIHIRTKKYKIINTYYSLYQLVFSTLTNLEEEEEEAPLVLNYCDLFTEFKSSR